MKHLVTKSLCLSLLVLGLHASFGQKQFDDLKKTLNAEQVTVDATAPMVRKLMKATNQKNPNIKGIEIPVDQVAKYAAVIVLQTRTATSKGDMIDSVAYQAAEDATYYGLKRLLEIAKTYNVPGVEWIEENVLKEETVSGYAVRRLLRLVIRPTVNELRQKTGL